MMEYKFMHSPEYYKMMSERDSIDRALARRDKVFELLKCLIGRDPKLSLSAEDGEIAFVGDTPVELLVPFACDLYDQLVEDTY